LLYYFVIEVNSIVLKLKSNDSAAYIEELQHWQLRRRIIYILLIIFQIGIAITRLADKISSTPDIEQDKGLLIA